MRPFPTLLIMICGLLAACAGPHPERLARAIKHGDMAAYSKQIEQLEDLDAPIGGEWYWPPLQLAVFHAQTEIITDLLQRGANINLHNLKDGSTALHVACNQQEDAIAMLLMERGAEIDAVDERGRTALHNAIIFEDPPLVYRLLAQGADPDIVDADGYSPVLMACQRFEDEMLDYLLQSGGDPQLTGPAGRNALLISVANGDEAAVRLLLEWGMPVSGRDAAGDAALHIASRNGNLEVTELLLRYGADSRERNAAGLLPHELAGSWPDIQALLQRHELERPAD